MVHACLSCLFRAVRWIPVIFITLIILWSYYAYVLALCIFTVQYAIEKVLYLTFYHALFIMFTWSYIKAIFADPMLPPKQFYLSAEDKQALEDLDRVDRQQEMLKTMAKGLPIATRTLSGAVRYCDQCDAVKPDRCHHCSVCGNCVLKMDHHCPWVNNCVGFSNYKFFILFLFYGILYTAFVAATDFMYFIKFWNNDLDGAEKFHVLFLFFAAVMFAISLFSLFSYHLFLLNTNRTTLESFRPPVFSTGPDKNGFSLGQARNVREVFGDDRRLWPFPVRTALGDGVSFPTRLETDDHDHLLSQRQKWVEDGLTSDEETTVFTRDNHHEGERQGLTYIDESMFYQHSNGDIIDNDHTDNEDPDPHFHA